jgi:spore cortex formation protein SpoVR/YcgB (stage V sporulation)
MALPSDAMASVQFDSMTNVRSSTDYGKEETHRFCDAILILKTSILPRQARDKHRESSTQKRDYRFLSFNCK